LFKKKTKTIIMWDETLDQKSLKNEISNLAVLATLHDLSLTQTTVDQWRNCWLMWMCAMFFTVNVTIETEWYQTHS